ncbi:GRAM domain-containing protein 2A isoform X3 [Halyomorpha halys]|uniref:GRAM domain-containing protein 2A isoform X3 n=1 Tax=Halyomorpha halys TaxID=286706 RepID=UPI0034D24D09
MTVKFRNVIGLHFMGNVVSLSIGLQFLCAAYPPSANYKNTLGKSGGETIPQSVRLCLSVRLFLSTGTILPYVMVEMVPEASAQECASAAAQEILISSPGSSKARQKKFHRHFKTVPPDEKVLNYYSCALVADILLQGHLYITRNYFAFYSNVFGYVTKLLIPTSTVLKVTKEKTAYIIPNAVGITTEDDKHVFGSLLSRDSTYKLMVQVWNAALAPTPCNTLPKSDCIEERLKEELEEPIIPDEESSLSGTGIEVKSYHDMFSQTTPGTRAPFLTFLRSLPRPTLLLVISTGLLILLFASATVLLYRIARLQQPYDFSSRSMNEVHAYINTNLEHISKVRESLEKLSFLIENGGKYHS